MTVGILTKLQAVSPAIPPAAPTLQHLPGNLGNPHALLWALQGVGLMVPTKLSAAAATGNLRASGHRYPVTEVDAALSRTSLSLSERMRLKSAMGHAGIIQP